MNYRERRRTVGRRPTNRFFRFVAYLLKVDDNMGALTATIFNYIMLDVTGHKSGSEFDAVDRLRSKTSFSRHTHPHSG